MGYCQVSNIETLGTFAGQPFKASGTSPTISEVQEIIDEYADDIDSELYEAGVDTPVSVLTSPKAHALLVKLNAWGAAGEIQDSTFFRGKKNTSDSRSAYNKKYTDKLKKYKERPILLQDAVLRDTHKVSQTGEESLLYSSLTSKYDSTEYDSTESISITPELRKGFKW